jgi:excisionase family DNA binding protein
MTTEYEELLNIEQAARLLNVSETSLRRWTNSGWLPCLRVGGRRERRFRRTDLLAFIDEQSGRGADRARGAAARRVVVDGIELAYGTHLCALVESDAGKVAQAVTFLVGGIRSGSVCYLAGPTGGGHAVVARLEERRPSLRTDIRAGRFVVSVYAESGQAQLEYWVSQMRAATRHGARSLRVVADVVGLGERVSGDELADYEAGYEKLVARRFPVVTLCQYDIRRFSTLALFHALKGHPDTFAYPVDRLLA